MPVIHDNFLNFSSIPPKQNIPPLKFYQSSLLHSYRIYHLKVKVKVTQTCPTLCDPMDYTVHRILQARILEWIAIPFLKGSSQPRDQTKVSRIAGRFFTS